MQPVDHTFLIPRPVMYEKDVLAQQQWGRMAYRIESGASQVVENSDTVGLVNAFSREIALLGGFALDRDA